MDNRLRFLYHGKTELWGRGKAVWAGNEKTGTSAKESRGGKAPRCFGSVTWSELEVAKHTGLNRREKPLLFLSCPYRKPTQVDGERILRPAGEALLRNSAKWPRNFGRRGARETWPQRNGPSNCLAKTQVYAKPKGEVYGLTPARCWKVKRRG